MQVPRAGTLHGDICYACWFAVISNDAMQHSARGEGGTVLRGLGEEWVRHQSVTPGHTRYEALLQFFTFGVLYLEVRRGAAGVAHDKGLGIRHQRNGTNYVDDLASVSGAAQGVDVVHNHRKRWGWCLNVSG